MNRKLLNGSMSFVGLLLMGGCFTISQSEYPAIELSKAVGDVCLGLEGYSATQVGYVPAWTPNGWLAVLQPTDVYRKRAVDSFERAGFNMRAAKCDYTVSLVFTYRRPHPDRAWHALETLFSATLLFRGGAVWCGQVKIHESATGKCLFTRDYEQTYEAHGWSFLPLFGWCDYEELHEEYVKMWCLNALTDRSCGDVTAFLAKQKNLK